MLSIYLSRFLYKLNETCISFFNTVKYLNLCKRFGYVDLGLNVIACDCHIGTTVITLQTAAHHCKDIIYVLKQLLKSAVDLTDLNFKRIATEQIFLSASSTY